VHEAQHNDQGSYSNIAMKKSSVLCFVLIGPSLVLASGGPTASRTEAATIANEVRLQIEKSEQFPSDRPTTIRWLVKPAKAAKAATSPTVGVAQIQFKGLTNSYCRLVASASASPSPVFLVPVPESVNHDTCKGVRSFHSGDLNDDGTVDYWYVARVQSNRYTADVGEALVFLGQPDKPEAICYSTSASRAIDPTNTSLAAATVAINNELKRTGKATHKCD
jgi:hypothetical protein